MEGGFGFECRNPDAFLVIVAFQITSWLLQLLVQETFSCCVCSSCDEKAQSLRTWVLWCSAEMELDLAQTTVAVAHLACAIPSVFITLTFFMPLICDIKW